jgi:hypothetical protein
MRVFQRIPDAGLCRKVHDHFGPYRPEQFHHSLPVGKIEKMETETRMRRQESQAVFLELNVVIGIQIIHPNDLMTLIQ